MEPSESVEARAFVVVTKEVELRRKEAVGR